MTKTSHTSPWSRIAALLGLLSLVSVVFVAIVSQRSDDQADGPPANSTSTQVPLPEDDGPVAEGTTTPSVMGSTTTITDSDPNTLYVSPSGSDANSGQSPEIAFGTIEHAIRSTRPGMTLFVMDGTHTITNAGPTQIPFRRDGSPDAWTTITAAPGARPVIVANQGTAFEPSGSYIEVSGLTIRGENFSQNNAYGVGILVADGHHFKITDNTVSGFPVGGIAAVRASHLRFERNVVYDNSKWGPEQGSGLSTWIGTNYGFPDDEHGYTDYFVDNIIYRNENLVTSKWSPGNITDGNGIIIDTNIDTGFTGRTLIANNIIVDNGGRSITVYKSHRVDVVNNSTYANGRTGARLLGGGAEVSVVDGRDVRLSNNLFWNDGTWPTLVIANSRDVTATANAFVGGRVEGIAADGNVLLPANPGLASAAPGPDAGDFLLTPDSPLVDAGVSIPSVVTRDFFGNPRLTGGAVDIGAVELATGAPAPSPSPPNDPAPPTSSPPTTAPTATTAAPSTAPPSTAPATTGPPVTAGPTSVVQAGAGLAPDDSAVVPPPADAPPVAPEAPTSAPRPLTGVAEPSAAGVVSLPSGELAAEPPPDAPTSNGIETEPGTVVRPLPADEPTDDAAPLLPPTPADADGPIDEVFDDPAAASDEIAAADDLALEPPPPGSLAFIETTPERSSGPPATIIVLVATLAGLAVLARAAHPQRRR